MCTVAVRVCGRVDVRVRWAVRGVAEWMRGEWVRRSDGHCGSEGGVGEWMWGEWVRGSDGYCGSEGVFESG